MDKHFYHFFVSLITAVGLHCIDSITSNEVCKICDGCLYGSISCQEPGKLFMVPDNLPTNIKKVIIIGQRFNSQSLQQNNFSHYAEFGMSIEQLTIMDCGIQEIEPNTFSKLTQLNKLDISKNSLLRIQGKTFANLQLELLRLDDNMGLTLDVDAFVNLTVSSLSIQNCGLRSLTFEHLNPLIKTSMLTTLRLTGNRLTTLDSRFEIFFISLKALSLAQNPFDCDCELLWLSKFLYGKDRSFIKPNVPQLSRNQDNIFMNDDFSMSGGSYPICASPNRLRGRKLISLTSEDFFCIPPQLKTLEIDFTTQSSNNQEQVLNVAQLKCSANGSPELRLGWFRRKLIINPDESASNFEQLPESRLVSPGVSEIILERNFTYKSSEFNSELLTCLGIDRYGNITTDVSIVWPDLQPASRDSPLLTSPEESNADDNTRKYHQSQLELIAVERSNDLFFKKKFTIIELIGAIVGTFTSTVAMFLTGYCILSFHRKKIAKKSKEILHDTSYRTGSTQNGTNSSFGKIIGYQVLNSNILPTTFLHSSISPLDTVNTAMYTNGQTHQPLSNRVQYASYDQSRNSGAVYSDCPTYDFPQFQLTLPNAIPPLPPIPTNGLNSKLISACNNNLPCDNEMNFQFCGLENSQNVGQCPLPVDGLDKKARNYTYNGASLAPSQSISNIAPTAFRSIIVPENFFSSTGTPTVPCFNNYVQSTHGNPTLSKNEALSDIITRQRLIYSNLPTTAQNNMLSYGVGT